MHFIFLAELELQAFGLICSAGANSIYDGKLAYVPALEDVLVWDVKRGQQVSIHARCNFETSHSNWAARNVA